MADDRIDRGDSASRVPPRVDGAAGAVVDALHGSPPRLNDLARARMERSLLETWSMRPAARVPLAMARSGLGRTPRLLWAGSIAAAALVGLGLGLQGLGLVGDRAPDALAAGTARFELRVDDAAMQSGTVAEGQTLESGPHGRIEVNLGTSLVGMAEGTRLRFDRLDARELRFGLAGGRIDVDFHPVRRGEQTMAVETRTARVLVVGTRFRVEVDGLGNTTVAVKEGVVEVVPRLGGASRRVRAGEATHVGVDDGDVAERAVRASLEDDMARFGATDSSDTDGAEAAGATDVAGRVEAEPTDMDFGDEPEALVGSMAAVERAERAEQTTVARQLEGAHRLLLQGRHQPAREALARIAEGPHAPRFRVEALTLVAESYTAQAQIPKAREAYERAVRVAPNLSAGHNAVFALARLIERHTNDRAGAVDAYERYLARAPHGALAAQARDALCRLGESDACR
jgi:hypothetical protein